MTCGHTKLYMDDVIRGPQQYPSCLLCQIHSLESKLDEETKIVDRIWGLYGRPSYDDLKGRSIYDLIKESIDRAQAAESRLDTEMKRTAEAVQLVKDRTDRGDSWREMADELEERLKAAESRLGAIQSVVLKMTEQAEGPLGEWDNGYRAAVNEIREAAISGNLCSYCGAPDNGTCAYPSERKPGCFQVRGVENPVTIATDRTNERQTCRHCGNPVPCACW